MSSQDTTSFSWSAGQLRPLSDTATTDALDATILVADSWLVTEGETLAIELHRERFLSAVAAYGSENDADAFWQTAIQLLPRIGNHFPRVELHQHGEGKGLVLRQRPAPALATSLAVCTHHGEDPRRHPSIKGPDIDALARAKRKAVQRGADEAVILSPAGHIVDGTHTAILWWRGAALCLPVPELARVDSVTARSIVTLAAALSIDVYYEEATPEDLDGMEVWAVNALHGIRIVTFWIDGPAPAQEPGRLKLWRSRLHRLRKPLATFPAG